MSALTNIAKPYATAAFQYALHRHQLAAWQVFLAAASMTAQHPTVSNLLKRSVLSSQDILTIFYDIMMAQSSVQEQSFKNFLALLAYHKRLMVLPSIAYLFNAYQATLQQTQHVTVITAIALDQHYQQQLTICLTKRLQQKITLHYAVDPALLGGVIIQIADKIIDASIRNQLTRLHEFFLR